LGTKIVLNKNVINTKIEQPFKPQLPSFREFSKNLKASTAPLDIHFRASVKELTNIIFVDIVHLIAV
jgi:hypothetical protein